MKITYPEMKAIYESMVQDLTKKLFVDIKEVHGWEQDEFLDVYEQESLDDEHLEFAHFSMDVH